MTIYRSASGRDAIRGWCLDQLDRWEVAHERRTVGSTLGPTHVVTAGAGPDLVLLAGTNFAAATWLELLERLAAGHRVHAVDLPGQPGLSHEVRPRRRAGDRYGEWLAELLPRLGGEVPFVLAHSLGAMVALRAAGRCHVAGLVLVDPAGLMRLRVTWRVMRPTIPWLRRPGPATSEPLLRMMMAPGGSPSWELTQWMGLVGQHVRTSLAPAPVGRAALADLRDVPTMVVSGDHDAFLPPRGLLRAVRRSLPEARYEHVAAAGHLLPHERPDVLVRLTTELTAA